MAMLVVVVTLAGASDKGNTFGGLAASPVKHAASMPTAALLPFFPALAKLGLHGTFPRPGAFRPDEAQTPERHLLRSAEPCGPSLV